MDRPSLKKTLIWAIAEMGLNDEGTSMTDPVNFLTPFGIVSGRMTYANEVDDSFYVKLAKVVFDQYKKDYEIDSDGPMPGNDGWLLIKDVTIQSTTGRFNIHLPEMVLFHDQVIGAFLGTVSQNDSQE